MPASPEPFEAWADRLNRAIGSGRPTPARSARSSAGRPADAVRAGDLALLAEPGADDPVLVEARAQKAAMIWVRARLSEDPGFQHRFPDRTDIGWLDKLLATTRLQELARVRIVKTGRGGFLRYDVASLAATWHGQRLLESLGFGKRRTMLDRDEFARLTEATARIKLVLPETVNPTTTERFFAGEEI